MGNNPSDSCTTAFVTASRHFLDVPIKIELLRFGARVPRKAHPPAAAFDLFLPKQPITPITQDGDGVEEGISEGQRGIYIPVGGRARLGLGFSTEIPEGYCAHILSRSSTQGFVYHGVIDSDYRGEWIVSLCNHTQHRKFFPWWCKIAQFYLQEVIPTTFEVVPKGSLTPTARAGGGFGSTGTF
jgi:dUTPase